MKEQVPAKTPKESRSCTAHPHPSEKKRWPLGSWGTESLEMGPLPGLRRREALLSASFFEDLELFLMKCAVFSLPTPHCVP